VNALLNPSVRQIVAQIDAVLRHDPAAMAIGIRAQGNEHWPSRVTVGDREFALAWCPSPITVREQLVALANEAGALAGQSSAAVPGLVVLTPLSDHALGADVLARLSRGKVFPVEAWDMLRHAFQAKEIDSRLARWSWVAEALLENLPAGGYPPARGGVLDVETAWSHTLRSVLGMSTEQGGRPDLPSVLRWTLSPEAAQRYGDLNEKARRQIGEWLIEILGNCGCLIGQVLDAGYGGELMPIALVCGMVLDRPEGRPVSPELLAAAVRLEKFTGGVPVPIREGLRLHAAAVQVTGSMDSSTLMPILDVADRLAESLHLTNFAHLSNDLPSGFSSRLILFADAITAFLAAQSEKKDAVRAAATDAVLMAGQRVIAHRLSTHQGHRVRRVEMAMRLVRWLSQADSPPQLGLEAQVKAYADDGAYADWARLALLGGDELAGATRAYGLLREAARVRRDAMNKLFSQVLAAWNQGGCPQLQSVIPVEQIVADVLAPVAALAPVLLLVVDGLSFPIYRELLEDAQRQGWNEVLPHGREQAATGLATIPSITEISRTSLFCGRLIQGQAANEKSGFAQHPALIPLVPSNRLSAKPVLFHKGDLTAGGDGIGLSEVVRDAIGSRERKLVAIVFNGVDDHLSGSDQLNQRWTLDDLRLIKPILYEARNAGRLVLITADHGHVIDEATHVLAGMNDGTDKASAKSAEFAMGDRWRNLAGAPVSAEEALLSGGRVLAPSGQQQVVVPWSETLRYGSRKNGYHGGISLQEMLVPIAVLTTGGSAPEGFRYAPSALPAWWDLAVLTRPTQEYAGSQARLKEPAKKAKTPSADTLQHPLFELPAAEAAQQKQPSPPDSDWIAGLLVSSVFVSQKQWVARAAVKDDEIRALLEALSERGGKISKAALAGRLSMPLMRVSGFVNAARRLLNVDQAPVIMVDETEGSVSLNRALLDTQFFSNKGSQQ
jgi:hypothetical protein